MVGEFACERKQGSNGRYYKIKKIAEDSGEQPSTYQVSPQLPIGLALKHDINPAYTDQDVVNKRKDHRHPMMLRECYSNNLYDWNRKQTIEYVEIEVVGRRRSENVGKPEEEPKQRNGGR